MNKNELVAAVADKVGVTKVETEKVIDTMIDIIVATLKAGGEVRLVGFGTFEVTARKGGKGRNPRTGEEIDIASTNTPKFRAGKQLKEAVNP
ncbi:MAG TPA: DNA-binding protein HU [Alphaproteobacteria bacterium]|nr:DNA-binding protein HU [Alphaproteobacteria bacterium]HAJ45498.1 DNA-binding protein HU [Alphaproteobacteria bacterium]